MIEIVDAAACIACDLCVKVCPTDVFDRGEDGVPVISRQSDCQTCFMCEAYCPVDALYVSPVSTPVAPGNPQPTRRGRAQWTSRRVPRDDRLGPGRLGRAPRPEPDVESLSSAGGSRSRSRPLADHPWNHRRASATEPLFLQTSKRDSQ